MNEWRGCYDEGWQGEVVPEAFSHPAKFSRALIRRIYDHAFAEGWLRSGDTVVDCFGGVALGALDGMWNGVAWLGVELEPKFVSLAQQNIDLWQRKYGSKPGFGSAQILQGDSRKLSEIIAGADLVCSSPPYAESLNSKQSAEATTRRLLAAGYDDAFIRAHVTNPGSQFNNDQRYGQSPGQLGAMKEGEAPTVDCVISSPPYAGSDTSASHTQGHSRLDPTSPNYRPFAVRSIADGYNDAREYGDSPGQLGAMKEGEAPTVDLVCSSPPYAAIATGAGGLNTKPGKDGQQSGRSPDSSSQATDQHYGESEGQLSGMSEGRFDAVVSSPPYEGTEVNPGNAGGAMQKRDKARGKIGGDSFTDHSADGYGQATENLGNQSGDTFWQAAREIVAQCHAILRPGGHAIWVCKDFVRKGRRVPFSDQWQALCEAQGFRLVCRHRAMLVAHHGEQDGLFGEAKQLTTARKSFFRRLAEAKGSPAIDWEDVLCLVRP